MNLGELRPGMEEVDLEVTIISLEDPKEVESSGGYKHTIVVGEVKDKVDTKNLTVWNESIQLLEKVKPGDKVNLINCFITSFKGVLSVNVGRESRVEKI